jgi:rhomboid protease GluP
MVSERKCTALGLSLSVQWIMATDGEIDFSAYTREQLDSAVSRMDRYRYPINYKNLSAEYQRRRIAERRATELAANSGTVAPPDNMLTVPRPFAVTFEPSGGPTKWLGPSRNDFHLVASGSIQVDGEIVRVTGRRFSIWFALPLPRTDELGRQFIVNVECDGPVVRFELRVPGEKCCGLTLWLRSASEAEELTRTLPTERTPDFVPKLLAHVEFERRLIAQSPTPRVTYALIVVNVCVYLVTAAGTNHLLGFDGPSLVPLGSNFGPYTTAGDGWRLFTALFLHLGLIHLAFNMWALASFGPIVERLYGSVTFGVIYAFAGLIGGLASVTWRPDINSVGASGAIFGILGALMAVQLRNGGSIPKSVLRPLRTTSLIYIGCALFAGFLSTGVDNAAHLGGLCTGMLLGLASARPITGLSLSTAETRRRLTLAAPIILALLLAGIASAHWATARLIGEVAYLHVLHWFTPRESDAILRWHELAHLAVAGKWNEDTYANKVEDEIVSFWKEADARLGKLDLKTDSASYENLRLLQSVADGRLGGYRLVVQGLRKHDSDLAAKALRDLASIDALISERVARGNSHP